MPLDIPNLDDRRYQDILDEALARIPVHNPEWTNVTPSDPGVTLVQLFAFMTESLLYRANQIPERNRKKFLTLLGVGVKPAASARGLVWFANRDGPLESRVLDAGFTVRAERIPFRSERGVDVLPVEAVAYYKRWLRDPDEGLLEASQRLYASFLGSEAAELKLYETTPLDPSGATAVDVAADSVDGFVWIALMARSRDANDPERVRRALAGRTLSLGLVPVVDDTERDLLPGEAARPVADLVRVELPLPTVGTYRRVETMPQGDVLREPGVIEVGLPKTLSAWGDVDPLEAGVGDLPPDLEETNRASRVVTWLRVAVPVRVAWMGINAVTVRQEDAVRGESLPNGTGDPGQEVVLAHRPVVPGSVRVTVTPAGGAPQVWSEVDDLFHAGPEVIAPDPRHPPRRADRSRAASRVFALEPSTGRIRFGDGTRGARPPNGAALRADYRYGRGRDGNVAAGAIRGGAGLPDGYRVANSVATWGGVDAQSVAEAEQSIPSHLRHRDRLVSADDFVDIVRATPGVTVGRVEVLPAYHPDLAPNVPGGAPGAVTVMVVPRHDPVHPDAPEPDPAFLDAICRHLHPRRLITTELHVRPPAYRDVYVSIGIQVLSGHAAAVVREAVKKGVQRFLSPLPASVADDPFERPTPSNDPGSPHWAWPLGKGVRALELLTIANRTEGVQFIDPAALLLGTADQAGDVALQGLQLPRLAALSVTLGEPLPLDELRGRATPGPTTPALPVPVLPRECD